MAFTICTVARLQVARIIVPQRFSPKVFPKGFPQRFNQKVFHDASTHGTPHPPAGYVYNKNLQGNEEFRGYELRVNGNLLKACANPDRVSDLHALCR